MNPILQVFYSVFSGLLLAAAIPNEFFLLGCPIFTLVAFIPLYIAISSAKSYKWAFAIGFTQTITTHIASSFWLAFFKDFAALTLGASAVGTGFIGGFFGLFLYLPFSTSYYRNTLNIKSLHKGFLYSNSFRILYFASLYTLYEWIKSIGFLGYPWGTISATMFTWPIVMQLSSITGTYGITYLVMIINCFIAEVIMSRQAGDIFSFHIKQSTKIYIKYPKNDIFGLKIIAETFSILIILSLLNGCYEYYKYRKPIKELTTILVQQNFNPWSESSDREAILISENLTKKQIDKLAESNDTADLVVWSEGCLQRPFPYSDNYYSYFPEEYSLKEFIKDTNVPFLIGGSYVKGDDRFYNAALMFDEQGFFRGHYAKMHLVPFAEAIPFMEYPKIKDFFEKIIGISAGWYPGEQYVYFDIPCRKTEYYPLPIKKSINLSKPYYNQYEEENLTTTVKISTPICFDDAFTDVMRPMFLNGAELFVNITDDSWSLTKSSETQHFCIAAYRAIEYRTTLIRSANAGYSVVVDPTGRIINDQPLFEQSSTICEVPIYQRNMTIYARFGNWLPHLLGILFIIYCVYIFIHLKKNTV